MKCYRYLKLIPYNVGRDTAICPSITLKKILLYNNAVDPDPWQRSMFGHRFFMIKILAGQQFYFFYQSQIQRSLYPQKLQREHKFCRFFLLWGVILNFLDPIHWHNWIWIRIHTIGSNNLQLDEARVSPLLHIPDQDPCEVTASAQVIHLAQRHQLPYKYV